MNPSHRNFGKIPWTLDQWHTFGRRCEEVRHSLLDFRTNFPPTLGFTRWHARRIFSVDERLLKATQETDKLFSKSTGLTSMGQGRMYIAPAVGLLFLWIGSHSLGPLTREEWTALGDKVKAIRAALRSLADELQTNPAATLRLLDRFEGVVGSLDRTKSKLDSLCCVQHPDWHEFTHVFYREPSHAQAR